MWNLQSQLEVMKQILTCSIGPEGLNSFPSPLAQSGEHSFLEKSNNFNFQNDYYINHISFCYNFHIKFVTQHIRWRSKPLSLILMKNNYGYRSKWCSTKGIKSTVVFFKNLAVYHKGAFSLWFQLTVVNQFLLTRLEPNRKNINFWSLQITFSTSTDVTDSAWSVMSRSQADILLTWILSLILKLEIIYFAEWRKQCISSVQIN